MGAGKSQVSAFIQMQYPVLDCDKVNAFLLKRGNEGYQALKAHHIPVFLESGEINKAAMARYMFSDPKKKQKVENILYPLILDKMNEWVAKQNTILSFIEMPLLFENHMESYFDSVWCVVTQDGIALQRLQKYRHISEKEAKARLAYQMRPEEKMAKSTIVLWNDGTLQDLKKQVQQAIQKEVSNVANM